MGGIICTARVARARHGDGAFASKPTRSSGLLLICCANEACRRHTRSSGAELTSAPRRPDVPGGLLPPVLCRWAANAHSWMHAPRWRSRRSSSSESSNHHENIAQRALNANASGEVGLVGSGWTIAPAHGRQRWPCCLSRGPGAASVSVLDVPMEPRPRFWARGGRKRRGRGGQSVRTKRARPKRSHRSARVSDLFSIHGLGPPSKWRSK